MSGHYVETKKGLRVVHCPDAGCCPTGYCRDEAVIRGSWPPVKQSPVAEGGQGGRGCLKAALDFVHSILSGQDRYGDSRTPAQQI